MPVGVYQRKPRRVLTPFDYKNCQRCGREFVRPLSCSFKAWAERQFCSYRCRFIGPDFPEAMELYVERIPESGCWIWMHCFSQKYPCTRQGDKSAVKAHIASYRHFKGPIPPGLQVCHKCDIPSCINPDHLFLGTAKDNYDDMVRKGRRRSVRGIDVNTAKLNEDQVLAIRGETGTQEEIAKKYKVSQTLISQIRKRKIWRHV